MTMPASSLVAALNSLQKAMMLTPCWPRAGPTGGAGLAAPAGICNLICPVIFFAIVREWNVGMMEKCNDGQSALAQYSIIPSFLFIFLAFFHLPVFQFDRGIPAENIDRYLEFAPLRLDFLDNAAEIEEGTIVNLDGFTDFKVNLRLFMFFGSRN